LHQRCGATSVKEVDRAWVIVDIGRLQAAIEVREEVDLLSHILAQSEDARNGNTGVWLGVVANDNSVDKQRQQSVLVGRSVVHKESSSIFVTQGGRCRTIIASDYVRKEQNTGKRFAQHDFE
jgi:hypothetical protein